MQGLTTHLVLGFPQWKIDVFLEVDVSKDAVGGVLFQDDREV